jgi:hypothetical protein
LLHRRTAIPYVTTHTNADKGKQGEARIAEGGDEADDLQQNI